MPESLQKHEATGHRQRLKDRWKRAGIEGFEDHEVLELLLSYAIPRKDTKPLAKKLIQTSGSLEGLWKQPLDRLTNYEGLGQHSATLIHLVGQLMRKPQNELQGKKLNSPSDVGDYFLRVLGASPEEFMYLVLLDQKNCVKEVVQCEHGIENRAQVYTKRIMRACLDHFATGVILVHNHPSGQPEFSQQDQVFTQHIKKTLESIEIRLLDHLLVSGESVISMQESGQI